MYKTYWVFYYVAHFKQNLRMNQSNPGDLTVFKLHNYRLEEPIIQILHGAKERP